MLRLGVTRLLARRARTTACPISMRMRMLSSSGDGSDISDGSSSSSSSSTAATSASTPVEFHSVDTMKPTKTVPLFPTSNVFFPGEVASVFVFEPRYKVMMKDLDNEKPVIGFVRQPAMDPPEDEPFPLSTDWHSTTVGCLAEVVAHTRQKDSRERIKLRFFERFRVNDASRSLVGYWQGTVQRLTDDRITHSELQQAEVLSRTVSALLNEYAKLAVGSNTQLLNRFQMRHSAMVSKGLVPFSFWVALQIKAALPATESSKNICQELLEAKSVVARLEHASVLLSDIIDNEAKEQMTTQVVAEQIAAEANRLHNPLGNLRSQDHEDM